MKQIKSYQIYSIISVVILVLLIFASCTVGYKNDGNEVTWHTWNEGSGRNSRKVDADPETFEVLDDNYGRDKTHAFYRGDIIDGADGQSFRVFENDYAADASKVYDSGTLLKGADPATFKVHSYELTEDKNDFYNNGKALNVKDKSSFEILRYSSGENTSWGKDRYNGYYLNGTVIPNIDYATFHPIEANKPMQSGCYAADKRRVFFMGKEVPGADPATFREVDFYIGQDKYRAYQKGIPTRIKDYTKLTQLGRLITLTGRISTIYILIFFPKLMSHPSFIFPTTGIKMRHMYGGVINWLTAQIQRPSNQCLSHHIIREIKKVWEVISTMGKTTGMFFGMIL